MEWLDLVLNLLLQARVTDDNSDEIKKDNDNGSKQIESFNSKLRECEEKVKGYSNQMKEVCHEDTIKNESI